MAEMPWSKFFWSDWESDQGLRLCSLAAQGLWMRMLCVCARHDPKGYLSINGNPLKVDAIARLAGVAETEAEILMAELELNGVFSRNRAGCIYSRRMVKDEKRSQEGRKNKKRGLKEALEKQGKNTASSRGASREPSPQKPEAIFQTASQLGASAKTYDRLIEAASSRGQCHQNLAMGIQPIMDLVAKGYDLDVDILPIIREKAAPSIRSWSYFVAIVVQRHAERQSVPEKPKAAPVDWAKRVAAFYDDGIWPIGWGPRPGDPGCEAPAELLKRTAA